MNELKKTLGEVENDNFKLMDENEQLNHKLEQHNHLLNQNENNKMEMAELNSN